MKKHTCDYLYAVYNLKDALLQI